MTMQRLEENTILVEPTPKIKLINKTANYEFTIIVPVFNEEDNIYTLEKKLSEFVSKSSLSDCVLFVNDCSAYQSKDRITFRYLLKIRKPVRQEFTITWK